MSKITLNKKWLLQHQLIIAGAFLVLVLTLAFATLTPLSPFSYAKSVPIQIGYNDAQNYWVLSAVVDETTAFKMVLDDETTKSVGENEEVKTKSEVGILVEPIQPYSKTNLADANIQYEAQINIKHRKVPAFDVNDAGWLTTAVYKLGVWKNGVKLTSQKVEVDYQKPKVIYLETLEGTVTVNNLGILPQGVEVPSGDLVVVYDPDGDAHVWNKANLLDMVDKWDSGKTYPYRNIFTLYGWDFVWEKTEKKGWLPQDVQLVHVSDVEITGTNQGITLTYSGIAFAGLISIYVPEDLADTIIVQLFNPIPIIIDVEPDPLPDIEEGDSTVFYVDVKNTGTEGTVSISVSSTYYSFNPLTETTKNMKADELFTFKFEAFALNVEEDTDTTSKILVQGRGGTDTYSLKGKILDVEGYTPVIPEPTETTLIVNVVDGNYKGIEEITVSIIYGASTATGMSNVDGVTPEFELGKYTGDVKIVTQETAKYPSKTEIITVQLGTNEHTIVLGAVLPWPLIIAVLVVVIVAAVAVLFVYRKRLLRRGR